MNRDLVRSVFLAVREGFSADRVVADPRLNRSFVDECRRVGLTETSLELNRSLLNLRKAGLLAGLTRSKRTSFANEDEYRFAAEMAIRHLERRDRVSLDDVICNPEAASEFDELAARLAPGFSSLQYRWAALNLRKSHKLAPEILGRAILAESIQRISLESLDVRQVPIQQGLYLFIHSENVLYVGESSNLRGRLKKHLDHSDNKGLAYWMWERGSQDLWLELHVLPSDTRTDVRVAMEVELIRSRNPLFNVKR